ncbi:MAG: alpha/beta fold hydrolase [Gemmatimonadota bacterium]
MAPPLSPLEMTVRAVDGLVLKGVLEYPEHSTGTRYPLAVLAHQYPATADSFGPLVEDLLDLGVACLAFDLRGHGASIHGPDGLMVVDTPEGFTSAAFGTAFVSSAGRVGFTRIDNDILRVASWGATQNFIDPARILLVGSSVGGSGVLLAAPLFPGLKGMVTFGAAGVPAFGADAHERIRRNLQSLSVPVLLASSDADPFDAAGNASTWGADLPNVSVCLVPGTDHGMAIYYEVRKDVLALVKTCLG